MLTHKSVAIPADPQLRADHAALRRVEKELRHRELKIQADIIGLAPLMQCAGLSCDRI
jgi:hypothetical protein